MVLNIIWGLSERFTAIGIHLRRTTPLPTFLQVRDELRLEELTMAKTPPTTALAALGGSGGSKSAAIPHQQQPQPPPQLQQQGGGGNSNYGHPRGKCGSRRHNRGGGGGHSGSGSGFRGMPGNTGAPLRLLRPTTTTRGLGPSICGLVPRLLLLMHLRHLRIRPMLLVHPPNGLATGRPSSRPYPSSTISSSTWLGSAGPCCKL